MKIRQRSPRTNAAARPGIWRRLLEALRDLGGGGQLVPVPVRVPAAGPRRPPSRSAYESRVHLAFGRRKDEPTKDGSENAGEGASEAEPPTDDGEDEDLASTLREPAVDAVGEGGEAPNDGPAGERPNWSLPAPGESSPFSFKSGKDQPDLPAWTPGPLSGGGFPSFSPPSEDEATAWPGGTEAEAVSFVPDPADSGPVPDPEWPTTAPEPLWSPETEGAVPSSPFVTSSFSDSPAVPEGEVSEAPEGVAAEEDAAQADEESELGGEEEMTPFEPESIPEVVALSEGAWTVTSPEAAHGFMAVVDTEDPSTHQGQAALVVDARAFPLPEGEVLFRNLRSGFTDPARLLRHLAGEGHTGVMHVAAVDERQTYIVLVDGYVVAVATDDHGKLTTTNRVSFPNFPNSQDVLNVITYPREIARGLGLLLHAPVHFRGLGAMFVNLDGLRSYLSKHSASGGMVVQSDTGTGVALFDEGRLVGAYSGSEAATTDLTPLRELIKDLDSEIDVRFGGPKELDPVPLDTLLAGYPL